MVKKEKFLNLSLADLNQKETDLRSELETLNLKKNIGQQQKPSKFSSIRRDIARVLTAKRALMVKQNT